jgi:hypothetical protein
MAGSRTRGGLATAMRRSARRRRGRPRRGRRPVERSPPPERFNGVEGETPCTVRTRRAGGGCHAQAVTPDPGQRCATAAVGRITGAGGARRSGRQGKPENGTTDAHRCTPMGRSSACSFTAEPSRPHFTSRPGLMSSAAGSVRVPSVCIGVHRWFHCLACLAACRILPKASGIAMPGQDSMHLTRPPSAIVRRHPCPAMPPRGRRRRAPEPHAPVPAGLAQACGDTPCPAEKSRP